MNDIFDGEQKLRRKAKRRNEQLEGKYEEKIELVDVKKSEEEAVKCVEKTKYLGTIISRNGKSSEDIKRLIDIARTTTNQLSKSIYRAKKHQTENQNQPAYKPYELHFALQCRMLADL